MGETRCATPLWAGHSAVSHRVQGSPASWAPTSSMGRGNGAFPDDVLQEWAREPTRRLGETGSGNKANSMVVFLKCELETQDAQWCQPCGSSSWCFSVVSSLSSPMSASFQELCVPKQFSMQLQRRFWWGLARHGHDPCPGGRAARHRGDVPSCAFCTSPVGDLTHCLSCCAAFTDLRVQWCAAAHVAPTKASLWTQHCSTLGFSIRRIWRTPVALCAHTSSLLVRCARVDSCRRGRADS